MAFKLDLPRDLPHFSIECELDGASFVFEFRWNHIAERWTLKISDTSENVLAAGLLLVTGTPIAARLPDPRLFQGLLEVVDTAGKDEDPGLNDLGTRVELRYTPAEA